jgi:signal peptidase I
VIARKLRKSFEPKPYNSWHYYLLAVAVSWSLSEVVFKGMVVQAFKIPAGSMAPTLQSGDHIFVDKLAYGLRNPVSNKCLAFCGRPQRGDVVVFIFPEDRTKDFVKRVIAVGGDTVEIHGKKIYINGKQIDDPHAHFEGDDPAPGFPLATILVRERSQKTTSLSWGIIAIRVTTAGSGVSPT